MFLRFFVTNYCFWYLDTSKRDFINNNLTKSYHTNRRHRATATMCHVKSGTQRLRATSMTGHDDFGPRQRQDTTTSGHVNDRARPLMGLETQTPLEPLPVYVFFLFLILLVLTFYSQLYYVYGNRRDHCYTQQLEPLRTRPLAPFFITMPIYLSILLVLTLSPLLLYSLVSTSICK